MPRIYCSHSSDNTLSRYAINPGSSKENDPVRALSGRKSAIMVATAALSMALTIPAWAGDARSIALGGSVITNGHGVHGAVENPASLMAMKQRNEKFHFRVGLTFEVRDSGDAIDTLTDDANDGLIDDIGDEVEALGTRVVQCNPFLPDRDQVCVDGTTGVADLSQRMLDILNVIDEETIDAQASMDMGVAFTRLNYPVAVNLRVSGTVAGTPDVADSDLDYVSEFATLLGDDVLTLGEAQDSPYLEASELGVALTVQQPEDVLASEGQGSALIRTQLGISIAGAYNVGNFVVDAGITPKISSLSAYDVAIQVRDEFDEASQSIQDRFEDSEVSETSFTFDAGASMALKAYPIRIAAVLRNVIPESINTANDFEFETTPQLIVGALYQKGKLSINADLALNEAKIDNFETQKMGVGLEFGTTKLAIRGGLSIDNSRDSDATSLSLGVGLGALQLGARLTSLESLEAGAQIAYSF